MVLKGPVITRLILCVLLLLSDEKMDFNLNLLLRYKFQT